VRSHNLLSIQGIDELIYIDVIDLDFTMQLLSNSRFMLEFFVMLLRNKLSQTMKILTTLFVLILFHDRIK